MIYQTPGWSWAWWRTAAPRPPPPRCSSRWPCSSSTFCTCQHADSTSEVVNLFMWSCQHIFVKMSTYRHYMWGCQLIHVKLSTYSCEVVNIFMWSCQHILVKMSTYRHYMWGCQLTHVKMSTNSCHDDIVQTLNWKLSTLFAFECELTDILCHHDVSTNEVVSLFSIKKKMSRTKCKM